MVVNKALRRQGRNIVHHRSVTAHVMPGSVAVSSGVQVNVHDGPIPGVALREILPDFHSRYRESRVYAHAVIDGITYLYVLAHCVSFDYFA